MPLDGRLAGRAKNGARYLPLIGVTAALAFVTTREVLGRTGGVPAVPLDDAYIHFQYARSIAEFHPFRYTPGATPTPGATSLLWPFLLSPFYVLGFRGEHLIWIAWAFGWTALALLARETTELARGLVRPRVAVATGAMVLAFGGSSWFAASGMEVVPFAWLLVRTARRAAEWIEARDGEPTSRAEPTGGDSALAAPPTYTELVVLSATVSLMRPEGVVAVVGVAGALLVRPHRGRRAFVVPILLTPLLPGALCLIATGHAMTSTAVAKWLPLNPYFKGDRLFAAIAANLGIFFGTLLDGHLWTSVFLPQGGRVLGWLALPALVLCGDRQRKWPRALLVLAVAAGMLIPTTYETFLVNRVRYIWPFAPAWIVALGALAEIFGALLERGFSRLELAFDGAATAIAFGFVGLFASRLAPSIDDLADSADAVLLQQVSLAHWAGGALPENARLGVNDTGALAYFSGRTTFDIVGLTTAGEARYWTAGPGSRFEHYEKLPRDRLPTHFIVYPEWFGVDALLGDELTFRTVHSTILGGATMTAYRARYDALGSGETPRDVDVKGRTLVDVLDVADVDSEAAHAYELLDATQMTDALVEDGGRADAGRLDREMDAFRLRLSANGALVLRVGAKGTPILHLEVDGREIARERLGPSVWEEALIALPADLGSDVHDVRIRAEGGTFDSLHYWSYR